MNNSLSLVVEQHAEEASFLAALRDYALRAPHYDIDHLGKLDNRLDAHLDGLRIGGIEAMLRGRAGAQGPRALGGPSCRGQPRTCRGQAQVLQNRSHPTPSLHDDIDTLPRVLHP
jgi:hypothetical protein